MGYSMEITRRIYNDDDGTHVEIGPDRDGLDLIEVRSGDAPTYMVFTPEQARHVAAALIAAANDANTPDQR